MSALETVVRTVPRAAYIHVPFCRHRCGYCDFTLIAGRDDLIPRYLESLRLEMRRHPHDPSSGTTELDTLFLGGGTPTHPTAEHLRDLVRHLRERFTFAPGYEVSVEANPLDLTEEKLVVLRDAGVNRISLGVQAFEDAALICLERDHVAAEVETIVRRTQRFIPRVSLDLIFGVPGQSLGQWRTALRRAIDLGVGHISTYGLTIEKGTAFYTRQRRGEFQATPEELECDMYAAAMEDLAAAGFEHYEISNFARPGERCRHNMVYWEGREYLAYGPGAARYVDGRRETNLRSVWGWLARIDRGLSPTFESEELAPEDRARERIFLALRLGDGINYARFHAETGFRLDELAAEAIDRHVDAGLLQDDGITLRLTRAGRFLANRVVQDFL
ncbi:MAG TPA: radical SAM family heme chaperone HemW [Planctomycetaceae bacterium]|nr:radical SAM family heme chaperone HemW [Planctomycetaceae bacterium]